MKQTNTRTNTMSLALIIAGVALWSLLGGTAFAQEQVLIFQDTFEVSETEITDLGFENDERQSGVLGATTYSDSSEDLTVLNSEWAPGKLSLFRSRVAIGFRFPRFTTSPSAVHSPSSLRLMPASMTRTTPLATGPQSYLGPHRKLVGHQCRRLRHPVPQQRRYPGF